MDCHFLYWKFSVRSTEKSCAGRRTLSGGTGSTQKAPQQTTTMKRLKSIAPSHSVRTSSPEGLPPTAVPRRSPPAACCRHQTSASHLPLLSPLARRSHLSCLPPPLVSHRVCRGVTFATTFSPRSSQLPLAHTTIALSSPSCFVAGTTITRSRHQPCLSLSWCIYSAFKNHSQVELLTPC